MSGREIVSVAVTGARYDVVIGRGVLGDAGELVRGVAPGRRVAVVTDETVRGLFGARVSEGLRGAGYDVVEIAIAPGERSKSWDVAGDVLESLAEARLDRTDTVVALGGGVVGDLAGFAAATYLRGVRFVQIPTTLLAQVDSSVGGKTGVDLRAGKNLAGAFKQPAIVLADTDTLRSLPDTEWKSGLAEVAKSAVIDGDDFTAWIEANAAALVGDDPDAVEEAVRRSVQFKSRVVSTDEKEEGVRECLNYGHTLAHAIENVAGYGVIPHGLAVAEGMRFAVRLAVEVAGAPDALVARQDAMLDSLGLPALPNSWEASEILGAMHSDKKARSGAVRFVLADSVGSWSCTAVDDSVIRKHLDTWSASKGRQ
jgi:3-dehydroquinate synthase